MGSGNPTWVLMLATQALYWALCPALTSWFRSYYPLDTYETQGDATAQSAFLCIFQ